MIKSSYSPKKITAKSKEEFYNEIENLGYEIFEDDGKWLILEKFPNVYEAEYTRYFKGDYELMLYNIREIGNRIESSRRIQSMITPKNIYLNEDTQKLIQRLEKRVGHELKLKFEEGNTPYVEIEKLPKGGYSFITEKYLNNLAEHFLYDGYKEKQDSFIVYLDPAIMYTRPGIKSAYTREDYDRFDEFGNYIPYQPTEEELAKKDEIKKVLKQELSDAYEPDPMDDYVGYDSTNERIDMACERVAKQFGVDTDFVEEIAGEIDRENIARQNAEPEYVYQHCKDKDRFWDWYNGEDISLEELGIDKEQMDKEVDEVVRKYVNSSYQIKSSSFDNGYMIITDESHVSNEEGFVDNIDEPSYWHPSDQVFYTDISDGYVYDTYEEAKKDLYEADQNCIQGVTPRIVEVSRFPKLRIISSKKNIKSSADSNVCSVEEFVDLISADWQTKEDFIDWVKDGIHGSDKLSTSRWMEIWRDYDAESKIAPEPEDQTELTISVGEFGQDGEITVRKLEDGKWHGSDGKSFMGYLKPDDILHWYRQDYGSAWLDSSRKPIKSSIITPWDTNQVTGTSDEDLGLSAVVETYGNEFVNVDTNTLNELKDTLVRYFDDDAYVRDWNINYPNDQIEDAYDIIDPEEMKPEDLARYFDYEAYGRDIRLEDNMVWDSENQYWISARDVDDEELNNDKYIFMRG